MVDRVWVYKDKESKIVNRDEAEALYKNGWADRPGYETCPGIHSKKPAVKENVEVVEEKPKKENLAEEKSKEFSQAIKKP